MRHSLAWKPAPRPSPGPALAITFAVALALGGCGGDGNGPGGEGGVDGGGPEGGWPDGAALDGSPPEPDRYECGSMTCTVEQACVHKIREDEDDEYMCTDGTECSNVFERYCPGAGGAMCEPRTVQLVDDGGDPADAGVDGGTGSDAGPDAGAGVEVPFVDCRYR